MLSSQRALRRLAILAAAGVPLVIVAVGLAQPPFGPGGGIPRPPMGPGGFGPRGPGGFGPGGPGMPAPPGNPAMPGAPGGPGRPGGGIPGFGQDRWEFKCSRCGAVLGTGQFGIDKPNLASCPSCGVRFGNTPAGARENVNDHIREVQERSGRGGAWDTRPVPQPGVGGAQVPGGQFTPPAPGPNIDDAAAAPFSNMPTYNPPTTARGRSSIVILVVFVVGGLLLLLLVAGLGAVIWMVTSAPRMSARREPARVARRDDGYRPV